MYLKYFVYVSSVNNLSDARYCSGMFVDYIGFNFDQKSKNKISIDNFKEIKNWINGPKIVAEFADSSITLGGILYFWLNLLNGYMRIGVITEDELVKGKTYLYNHEMPRSFDGIRQMMWAQQKNRQHVPLCQFHHLWDN